MIHSVLSDDANNLFFIFLKPVVEEAKKTNEYF